MNITFPFDLLYIFLTIITGVLYDKRKLFYDGYLVNRITMNKMKKIQIYKQLNWTKKKKYAYRETYIVKLQMPEVKRKSEVKIIK